MFFTDGYPVVSNHTKEITAVMNALSGLSKKISNAILIGYGSYYNKELMSKMAEKVGGALVHSERLEDYASSVGAFMGMESAKRIEVKSPSLYPISVVGYQDGSVVTLPIDSGKILVPENMDKIWVLQSKNHIADLVGFDTEIVKPDYIYEGLLACSYDLINKTQTDKAIDILGTSGDVHLIGLTANAWTNSEYGVAQKEISTAIKDEYSRYFSGKDTNYVPDPGAFCLMDALQILAEDDKAFFYPRHKSFSYNRIGVKTESVEGSLEFHGFDTNACRFGDLVWNSNRLNLSVRAKINGVVRIPANDLQLPVVFSCFVWRNYTIVKDGVINMDTIPVSVSKNTFDRLVNAGMIDAPDNDWETKKIFSLNLKSVPIVNRNLSTAPKSTEFISWLNRELELEYAQKYLNWLIAKNDPDGSATQQPIKYNLAQEEYLAQFGIKPDGCFQPKVIAQEATDFYYAKEFDVKIKSFSSAPKVEEVISWDGKKSLTPSKSFMLDVINNVNSWNTVDYMKEKNGIIVAQAAKIDLNKVKLELKSIRTKIQSTRFAVLLCKQWFPDLSERDGAVVKYVDREYTFSIKDVKENY
jgi:hypothetical protein